MSTVVGKIDLTNFEGDGLEVFGTEDADRLQGTGKGDLIVGFEGDDRINARGGDDSIVGGLGDDRILGGFGNDVIEGGQGFDEIFGQAGHDCIDGGLGNDSIRGGKGDDTIIGGPGYDTMFGGGGKDVFVFDIEDFLNGEIDTIGDFHVGQDKIVINGLTDHDEITFDPDSSTVSLNGHTIIDLTLAEDFRLPQLEDTDDGGFEII